MKYKNKLTHIKTTKPKASRRVKAAKPTRAAPKKVAPAKRSCLCGCGATAKSRFLPGHDAKLHSAVLKAKAVGRKLTVSEAAVGWLLGKPWSADGYTTK